MNLRESLETGLQKIDPIGIYDVEAVIDQLSDFNAAGFVQNATQRRLARVLSKLRDKGAILSVAHQESVSQFDLLLLRRSTSEPQKIETCPAHVARTMEWRKSETGAEFSSFLLEDLHMAQYSNPLRTSKNMTALRKSEQRASKWATERYLMETGGEIFHLLYTGEKGLLQPAVIERGNSGLEGPTVRIAPASTPNGIADQHGGPNDMRQEPHIKIIPNSQYLPPLKIEVWQD